MLRKKDADMEKLSDEAKKEVETMIHDAITKASSFSTRKIGDTPTDNNQLTPKGYVDGIAASVIGVVDAEIGAIQTSGLIINSLTGTNTINSSIVTTNETSILTGTLPASMMGSVDLLRYKASVSYTFANSATPALTIRFKLGSQTFSSVDYGTGDATSRIFEGLIEGTVQNTSVLTAQIGAARAVLTQDGSGSSLFSIGEYHSNTTTVDMGDTQTVSMTAQFSGNNRGTLTVHTADIQLLKRLIS